MTYEVKKEFETETPQGTLTLKEGQRLKLNEEEAIPLIQDGLIKPFCYWLKSTVADCQMPCFEIEARQVLHECPTFKTYWKKKFKGEEAANK